MTERSIPSKKLMFVMLVIFVAISCAFIQTQLRPNTVSVSNDPNSPLLSISTRIHPADLGFTYDGQSFAASSRSSVYLYQLSNGSVSQRLKTSGAEIERIELHPTRSLLAALDAKNRIWLWDYSTGELIHTFTPQLSWGRSIAFSPNGAYLAAGGHVQSDTATAAGAIYIWQLSDFSLLQEIERAYRVSTIAFSFDSKNLIVGGADEILSVFDGKPVAPLNTHFSVWGMQASQNAPYLIAIREKELVLMEQSGKYLKLIAARKNPICAIAISADAQFIATGPCQPTGEHRYLDSERTIQIWDRAAGKRVQSIDVNSPDISVLTFSPDGSMIAVGPPDYGSINIWRVAPDNLSP
jgi:WD40 repeat protein